MFHPSLKQFSEAKELCESYSGDHGRSHLVSIHDNDTNNFLVQNVVAKFGPVNTWIGLGDVYENGTFSWVDGSKFDYNNFHRTQPDLISTENCVHLWDLWVGNSPFTWNNIYCNVYYPFICQKTITPK
ncbi:Alpha-N-acetylgalactosamine-specific lectin [Holothuria leucospilota]|uniref:Alpha-N-acetylgalactosamine-specific lectin n=1 Tax=Holothuria leucospilota TaxID=206669 RepID=A0A9Q1C1A1_HOLLE|nr:Alpha-N-acetylgalactosamine-specific lectin [Holothuria leucospilota]